MMSAIPYRWRNIHIETFQLVVQVLERRNSIRTVSSGVFKVTPDLAKMGHGQYPLSNLASDKN